MAVVPEVKSHGASGMKAPRAKVTKEAAAACHGDPRLCGVMPELLAGVRLEREVGVLHDLVDHVGGHRRVDAAAHVHAAQLGRLALGAVAERPALHLELALHQLALGGHGEVFAGRHGEGARDQAGHPGQAHDGAPGLAPAMPRTRETLVTRPSLTPKTAARAPPPPEVPVVVRRVGVVLVRGAHRRQRSEALPRG